MSMGSVTCASASVSCGSWGLNTPGISPNGRRVGAAWVCGYDHEKSMVITAHGFAMPVKQAFAPVLKLRKWLNPVSLVPGWQCEGSALLFRRMALVELAVLVVIIVSRGA